MTRSAATLVLASLLVSLSCVAACSHDSPAHDVPERDPASNVPASSPPASSPPPGAAEFELVTAPPPPPTKAAAAQVFVDTETGMVGAAGRHARPIADDETAQFEEIGTFLGHLCARFGPPDANADGYRYIVRHKPSGTLFTATANAKWGFLYLAYASSLTASASPAPTPELRRILGRFDDFVDHTPPKNCEATFDSDEDGLARIGSAGGKGYIHPYPPLEAIAFRIAAAKKVAALEAPGASDVERDAQARAWVAPFVEWDALEDADRAKSTTELRAYWQRRFNETMAYKGRPGADAEITTTMACLLNEVSHPDVLASASQRAELSKLATNCE